MTVLASGSKGNSTLIASSRTRILVDAGLSCRELCKRIRSTGEDPESIDALLITHEHQDHVSGLEVLSRRFNIPVYFTRPTHAAWVRWMTPRPRTSYAEWLAARSASSALPGEAVASPAPETSGETGPDPAEICQLPAIEYFTAGSRFSIGDIDIRPFTIPHDAADPVGFIFEAEGIRMAIATDLGYLPPNVKFAFQGCNVLMMESNHDLEMLRDGPYPWPLKQRVMSRVGHLSNQAAAEFLGTSYDGSASHVVLAHLSEKNNLPELARVTAESALRERMSLLPSRIVLAEQDRASEPICF